MLLGCIVLKLSSTYLSDVFEIRLSSAPWGWEEHGMKQNDSKLWGTIVPPTSLILKHCRVFFPEVHFALCCYAFQLDHTAYPSLGVMITPLDNHLLGASLGEECQYRWA
jgi:hypothetical protein